MSQIKPAPCDVYVWENGMVMAFDACGLQMPELQGPMAECGGRVLTAADLATRFLFGESLRARPSGPGCRTMSRAQFNRLWNAALADSGADSATATTEAATADETH